MRKLLPVLLILVLLLGGCTTAKKPAPKATPKPTIKPGTTAVGFVHVDLDSAPETIQKMATENKNKKTITAIRSDGNVWLLATRGEKSTGGFSTRVKDVSRTVTDKGRVLLKVILEESDPAPGEIVTQAITNPIAAARLSVGQWPDQISFDLTTKPVKKAPATQSETPQKPKTGQNVQEGEFIKINSPPANATVTSPLTVTGTARVFEATFQVLIKDGTGRTLAKKTVTASNGAPEVGSFETTLSFQSPSSPISGIVEAFSSSAKDGTPQNIIAVPVMIK